MSRKKKNSNAKVFVVFIIICIVGLSLLALEIVNFVKKNKEMQESLKAEETVVEEEPKQEINFESFIKDKVFNKAEDIENLSKAEIHEIITTYEPRTKLDYLKFLTSATTEDGAKEVVENAIKSSNGNIFNIKCKVVDDDELFFGIYAVGKEVRENRPREEDIVQASYYVVPKKDYFDTKRNALNMDDYDKVKKLLDIKTYIEKKSNVLIQSFFTREDDGCHYDVYYITSLYSEELNDSVYELVKETTLINSATGVIESTNKEVIKDGLHFN